MSTEIMLMRGPSGVLLPADQQSKEELQRWPHHYGVRVKVKRARSLPFHRKFFAMLNLAFDAWEPPEIEHEGALVLKEFERFRKDLLINAGFFTRTIGLDGKIELEAESISFDNMEQGRFERVYSAVADVVLAKILRNYTRDDLDNVVNEMLSFV